MTVARRRSAMSSRVPRPRSACRRRSEAKFVVVGIALLPVIALGLLAGPQWGAILLGVEVGDRDRRPVADYPRLRAAHGGGRHRRRRRLPAAGGRQRDGRRPGAAERDRGSLPRPRAAARSWSWSRRWPRRGSSTSPTTSTARSPRPARGSTGRSRRCARRASTPAARSATTTTPTSRSRTRCASFAADEVIVSTHPPERSKWLERGVVERAKSEIPLPVTHVVVDLAAEDAAAARSA